MKVQFYGDEPTEVNADLFNVLHSSWDWKAGIIPEEAVDGLTGTFAEVYKVYFMDGTEEYVEVNMLAAIVNGEYEIIAEE